MLLGGTDNTEGAAQSAIMEDRNQWRGGAAGFGELRGIADPKNG